jgi:hypothetical protein
MSEEEKKEELGGKNVSVGITEHLYGLGVRLMVTDINNNKSEVFLTVDEAINLAGRFSSVANLSFVLGQIANLMQGGGADPKIIAP